MFERFTGRARQVVALAGEEARILNHGWIGTEHILLGLIHEGDGLAARSLVSLGISLDAVRQQVEEIIGRGQQAPSGHIPFTPRAKKVLELSLRESLQLGHNYIGTEHILLGLLREGDGVAAQVLVRLGADLKRVREQVIQMLHGYQGQDAGSAGSDLGGQARAVPPDDALGVLTGTSPVVREGTLVTLDADAAERLARRWATQPWPAYESDFAAMHFNDGTERTANWMLLVDALNFCFWGEPGEPRWSVEWRGQVWDGYYALAAPSHVTSSSSSGRSRPTLDGEACRCSIPPAKRSNSKPTSRPPTALSWAPPGQKAGSCSPPGPDGRSSRATWSAPSGASATKTSSGSSKSITCGTRSAHS